MSRKPVGKRGRMGKKRTSRKRERRTDNPSLTLPAREPHRSVERLALLADLVADDADQLQPGAAEQLADRLALLLDERLFQQHVLGVPGLHLALGDLGEDLRGF